MAGTRVQLYHKEIRTNSLVQAQWMQFIAARPAGLATSDESITSLFTVQGLTNRFLPPMNTLAPLLIPPLHHGLAHIRGAATSAPSTEKWGASSGRNSVPIIISSFNLS